jgi:TolB-like protein
VTQPPSGSAVSTWSALRRRKVVQWGLGYVAVAWGLVQALEFAVATFRWPEAITRVGAVVAVTGVPVAITLAWFHGDRGQQRATRLEIVILAAMLAVGGFVARQVASSPPATDSIAARPVAEPTTRSSPALDRHRIAVLPFENFGNDPANAAFASGVHDTLITQVSKVPGLAVISRSSVLQYAGQHPKMRDVADALHVGAVLEGSVARDGGRLRIQAQLIDAATDEHLWAETYDREADDLFAVQSEIAQAVAEQLRIHLASADVERLRAGLTRNPMAYEHYVLGRSHAARAEWPEAIVEFTRAVTLDPDFAAAHAELSMAYIWRGFLEPTMRAESVAAARIEMERAFELDPTLPEAHLARAVFYYRGERDIERSAEEFELAIRGLPNDAVAHRNFGHLRRWQGRFEEGAALLKRAAELDPGGDGVVSAANALAGLGRRKEAIAVAAAGLAVRPDDATLAVLPGTWAGDIDCDLVTQEANLEKDRRRFPASPVTYAVGWYVALQTGDGPAAVAAAERFASLADPDDDSRDWRMGLALLLAGKDGEGRRLLHRSLERSMRDANVAAPGDARANELSWTAIHYSALGEYAKAIEYVRRSLDQLPAGGAMLQRAPVLYFDAMALAQAGQVAAAAPLLREALAIPFPRGAKGVWCDPLAAPVRGDPSFRALMAELGADLSIDPTRRETWPRPTSLH